MSCFANPEWRHITVTDEQREKLGNVDVQKMVQVWEKEASPPPDRVWLLAQEIQVSTCIEQTQDLEQTVLDVPRGFVCMPTPPEAENLLSETNVALGLLFKHLKLHKLEANPRTRLTYFNRIPTHPKLASPKEMRGWLKSKPEFEVIDRFWSIYMNKLAKYFCLSVDELISDHCDMSIIKYEEHNGFFMHIDGLLRTDATVFSVGVGRPVIYDMTRVLDRKKHDKVCIIRSWNPQGTMMVLDGEARYKWAHGIPGSETDNGVKYTMVVRLPHTAGTLHRIGKCIEFNTEMYSITPSTEPATGKKTRSNPQIGAQHDSLLGLLTELENTRIQTHIPERIKRPGLPRLHPRPGWL
jgi:hypothetical protein